MGKEITVVLVVCRDTTPNLKNSMLLTLIQKLFLDF